MSVESIRNIGISAHIDAGKTTLSERILYYTRRIHAIHEVRGKDGVGAKMDSMELERERGITIQSAATHCFWKDHHVQIIDTPGHVDFTIEVERALRVLDGAILVLCGVAGVQSQSITVDRQMRRHRVPRLAFINKCDRKGAQPDRVVQQLRERLGLNPVLLQMPVRVDDEFETMIDLVRMEYLTFIGDYGDEIRRDPIPESLLAEALRRRETLLDAVSMLSDEVTEALLEQRLDVPTLVKAIREATISMRLLPVLVGTAYRNRGIQPLLDAVIDYLPSPIDVTNQAIDLDHDGERVEVVADPDAPMLALAFKLEDGRYGQLTWLRVYRGRLSRGDSIHRVSKGRRVKVGRLVRMHADEMEEIETCAAGDIVAVFGLECQSGESFTDGPRVAFTGIEVPDSVVSLGIKALQTADQSRLSKALQRFSKEDPTFRVGTDPETNETIIRGMGELHLEVYVERIRREYAVAVEVGAPKVAFREAITREVEFDYTHKKQTGGSGQYGRVCGRIEPAEEGAFEFVDRVVGGAIPREFISSVERGFRDMMEKGPLVGASMRGVRVILEDGAFHAVDSSDIAFYLAACGAWRDCCMKALPRVLEPIMRVEVEGPREYYSAMVGTLMARRGVVAGFTDHGEFIRIESDIPLSEMFGYSNALRSSSQGRSEYTMELARYQAVPMEIQEKLVKAYKLARAAGN